jgi:hypothetical protein
MNKYSKDTHLKGTALRLQFVLIVPHPILNIIGRIFEVNLGIDKHALWITKITSRKVLFLLGFLLMSR